MQWNNPTKDCKFAPICAEGIRCGASEENPMEYYRKDKRTWLQKIFKKSSYYEDLQTELKKYKKERKMIFLKKDEYYWYVEYDEYNTYYGDDGDTVIIGINEKDAKELADKILQKLYEVKKIDEDGNFIDQISYSKIKK